MSSRIGEILVRARLIDQLQLRSATAYQQQWGGRLARIVVEKRFAKEPAVVEALSKALGVPKVEIDKVEKDANALGKVDAVYAKEHAIFPCALKDNGKTLWVAMADPSDIPVIDDLALKTGARVRPVIASEGEILAAIERHYFGREPSASAFGAIAPSDEDAEEGKIVDLAGHTLIRNINDIKPPPGYAPPTPAAAAPAPAPSPGVNTMLDDLLGMGSAGPQLTPEEMERVRAIQDQQEKGARILRAVLDLCVQKRVFVPDEYRNKLSHG